MLLPALNSAREKARSTGCLNNLKQIGVANMLYIDTYDYYVGRGDGSYSQNTFAARLGRFLGYQMQVEATKQVDYYADDYAALVFRCPSATNPMFQTQQFMAGKYGLTYSINNVISNDGGLCYGAKATKVKKPAQKYFIFDAGDTSEYHATAPGNHDRVTYRHTAAGGASVVTTPQLAAQKGINVSFADGHAQNHKGAITPVTAADPDPEYANWKLD